MASVSRPAVQVFAIIGGTVSRVLQVLSVKRTVGGNLLDHAVISLDLGHPELQAFVANLDLARPLVNSPDGGQINLNGAECNIAAFIGGFLRVIHWGKLTGREIDMGANEGIQLVSRVEEYHFGRPLGFQRVFDPVSRTFTFSDHDIVFNPEVKGIILGNKRVSTLTVGEDLPYPVFIAPESVETQNARDFQNTSYSEFGDNFRRGELATENWNLQDAVLYLCGECNSEQTFIQNPAPENILLLPTDPAILKNHHIRPGLYLPHALNDLLEPYGFAACLDYESQASRRIRIIQSAVGTRREILWQPPGSILKVEEQNADRVNLDYDTSMAVNAITAIGDFHFMEHTFELKPAWDEEFDEAEFVNLLKNGPEWEANPQYHRVWRDWVLNEAGDYPRAWSIFAEGTPADLTTMFQETFGTDHPPVAPRRRKFLPMLTLDQRDRKPYGKTGGVHVEVFDIATGEWASLDPIFPWNEVQLLEDECGIRFSAPLPHVFLMADGTAARLRVTAVVQSDSRARAAVVARPTSVNVDVHTRVLDVGRRFHFRLLHPESAFAEDVQDGTLLADEAEAAEALLAFAIEARDAYDAANCSGTVRLAGMEYLEYQLGDLITGVRGRQVQFSLDQASPSIARYPQIVGIEYLPQEQQIILTLNEMKQTDAYVASLIRKTKRLK